MRYPVWITFLGLLFLSTASAWSATGDIGIGGAVGAANPIGDSTIRGHGSVGPALGAHIGYALTDALDAELSYDNLYVGRGVRSEPIIFSAVWHRRLVSGLEPFIQAGLGFGRGAGGDQFNNFATKGGLGLIFKYGNAISYGPQIIYHYVGDQGDAVRSIHTLTPGVFVTYHFSPSKIAQPIRMKL
jgi:hypothetical protein